MFGLSGRQLFLLLILVGIIFAGVQYIPGYINAIQFNDFMRQEVKYAVSSKKTPDMLRAQALQKAKELNIPLTKNDIRITRRGPSFTLEIDYRLPINLRVYQHDLEFHLSESGEVFENAPN